MSSLNRILAFIVLAVIFGVGWLVIDAIRSSPTRERAAMPTIIARGSDNGYPMQIDMRWAGIVTVPAPPQRIVPANAGTVDMVTALVGPSRIAAFPITADAWSRIGTNPSGYESIPRYERFTAELVLEHKPDLLVASPFNAPDTIRRLEEAGVPVLRMPDTFDIASVVESLQLLGEILDVPDESAELIADIRRREAALLERTHGNSHLRALAYANYGFGGTGAATQTTQHEVFRLAGVRNALAEAGHVGIVKLNFEDVLAIDPDLIVVSHREDTGVGVTEDLLLAEPSLRDLRAVREKQIVSLPARHFFTVSQEILQGGEALADLLETRDFSPRDESDGDESNGDESDGDESDGDES